LRLAWTISLKLKHCVSWYEKPLKFVAPLFQSILGIRSCWIRAEYWCWPGQVGFITCDVVDMQLRHHIAKRSNIHFVGFEMGVHEVSNAAGFVDKLGLLVGAEFKNFT